MVQKIHPRLGREGFETDFSHVFLVLLPFGVSRWQLPFPNSGPGSWPGSQAARLPGSGQSVLLGSTQSDRQSGSPTETRKWDPKTAGLRSAWSFPFLQTPHFAPFHPTACLPRTSDRSIVHVHVHVLVPSRVLNGSRLGICSRESGAGWTAALSSSTQAASRTRKQNRYSVLLLSTD